MPTKRDQINDLNDDIRACLDCIMGPDATNKVCCEGPLDAEVMIVGEAPGKEEDRTGRPFQGPAGLLLDKALEHLGIDRSRILVSNILRCRPVADNGKKNRQPKIEEINCCKKFIEREVGIIRPKIIIALGGTAVRTLLDVNLSMGNLHGKMMAGPHNIIVLAAYHPAYLLRQGESKKGIEDRAAWIEDLRLAFIQAGWLEKVRKNSAKKKKKAKKASK